MPRVLQNSVLVFSFVFFPLIFLLCACQDAHEERSALEVTRGIEVAGDDYKAVVELLVGWDQTCTGSFLSDHVIITAAHCMIGDVFLKMPEGDPIAPDKVFVTEEYTLAATQPIETCEDFKGNFSSSYDVAFMSFPAGTAKAFGVEPKDYFSIAKQPPKIGQHFNFVGFGSVDATQARGALSQGGIGIKRLGENRVEGFLTRDSSVIYANSTAYQLSPDERRLGDNSTEPGDSGGPVFWPGTRELIGIVSTGLDVPFCGYEVMSDFIFSVHSDWAQEALKSSI